jgi:predicted DNA-binding WGR domain protein
MSTPDFRDQDPVWVRYAELTGGGHDKFYELTIHLHDDGTFYVQKRWGRRPDAGGGQIKVEPYQSLNAAQTVSLNMLGEKIAKGYRETERPHGAGQRVFREVGHDFYADGDEAF